MSAFLLLISQEILKNFLHRHTKQFATRTISSKFRLGNWEPRFIDDSISSNTQVHALAHVL